MPSNVYYIPAGPANLATIFPAIDFKLVDTYSLDILDITNAPVGSTPVFQNYKLCEEDIKLHFVNYLGTIDSVPFGIVSVEQNTKSNTMQVPLQYPLISSRHGINRIDTKANNTYIVEALFDENDMNWISEVLGTPYLWIESATSYIPVVLADSKMILVKQEERYAYLVTLTFTLSHDKLLLNP